MHPYLKFGLISCILLTATGLTLFSSSPSSKTVCIRLLKGEITEQKASDILVGKGDWRGGGEDALIYQCGYLLKGEKSFIRWTAFYLHLSMFLPNEWFNS